MNISSDKTPGLEDDLLGRKLFAFEIANSLIAYGKKNKDGLVISITGEWGSGKTTLIQYVQHHLNNQIGSNSIIIDFNPWLFQKNEGIKESFMIHLALSLKELDTKITKVSAKVVEFLGAFRWIKYFSATGGNIQEGLESLAEHFSKQKSIVEIKNDIDEILRKKNKKIIAFIDDIDRLNPAQIFELFQTISLVTNFSNIIYVIAFDRSVVLNAVEKEFNGKGQEYLEKIIQVDYEIPIIRESTLRELFNLYIDQLKKEFNIKIDANSMASLWSYSGFRDYFKTIRDFKRFFNSFTFRLPSLINEINFLDFLKIEAIRIFDYKSYVHFYEVSKSNYRKRKSLVGILDEQQLKRLSPTANEIIKSLDNTSPDYLPTKKDPNKRLLDPAYFDRYFTLLCAENDIPEAELKQLVEEPRSRSQILQDAAKYNRLQNLIDRLIVSSFHSTYKSYSYSLISDLIKFFNENPLIFSENSDRIADILINLICGNKKNKVEFLKKFFQSFGDPSISPSLIHIYFFYFIRLFRQKDQTFRNDYYFFDQYYQEHYEKIESKYLPVFKSCVNYMWEPAQTRTSKFIKYLYLYIYAEIIPEEYVNIFESFTNDAEFSLYLASQLVKIYKDSNSLWKYEWPQKNSAFPDGTFVTLYNKVKAIDPETLNDFDKSVRHHLLLIDISEFPSIKFPRED